MSYTKLFDPVAAPLPEPGPAGIGTATRIADRSETVAYVYSDAVVLAVNLALATGRPLLVRGPSGTGKSSLARDLARRTGRVLTEVQMTSRIEAQDLLWQFDAIRRLQDAQIQQLRPDAAYIRPGPLWIAFDKNSAAEQSAAYRRGAVPQDGEDSARTIAAQPAVLLIDEIDKADPDVPNNLLTVLGNLAFTVEPLGQTIACEQPPLVVITTNEERDMPAAFVRRCIELVIPFPDRAQLEAIALAHFPDFDPATLARLADLAIAAMEAERSGVSTAEFLDLVQACAELGITSEDAIFSQVIDATLTKSRFAPR